MLRKLTAFLLCAVLLAAVAAPLCVLAEEVDVSDVVVDTSSGLWTVTWYSEDETVRLLSVQVSGAAGGDATLSVLSNSNCYAEVDGSAAPYGTGEITLAFGTDMGVETAYVSGGSYTKYTDMQLSVAVSVDGSVFFVNVTDEQGNPVGGVTVSVDVGDTIGAMTAVTDDFGGASFNTSGMEGGYTWTANAIGFEDGSGVTYLDGSASMTVGEAVVTEPPTTEPIVTQPSEEYSEPEEVSEPEEYSEPEETTEPAPALPTLPAEETSSVLDVPTYEAVRGTTTTAVAGTNVACNLSVDKTLLSQMKLKIGSFNKTGRLIVSQEDYKTLTELYGGTLVGALTASPYKAVTKEQIEKSKQSESFFAESSAEKALTVTFGLALDFLLEDGNELHVTDLSEVGKELMFDVQIPVPGNMKKCKSFGVAMTGEDTLTSLTQVKADKGMLSFRTPALGYYTIVGFTDGKVAATGGGSPLKTIFIVLIVAGVLFLAASGFLTYWFFFRKKGYDDASEYAVPEDATYYEEETPTDEQERADAEQFMREVLGYGNELAGTDDGRGNAAANEPTNLSAQEIIDRDGVDIYGLYSKRMDD